MEPEPVGRVRAEAKIENLNDVPVLIGELPLEHLDFVVDLCRRSLIGNRAHGGEHV